MLAKALVAFILMTTCCFAGSEREAIIRANLERIIHGKPACFSDQCQHQKRIAIDQIFALTSQLPNIATQFFFDPSGGIKSAYFWTSPHVNRPPLAPRKLSEWMRWWQKAQSKDRAAMAEFTSFIKNIFELSRTLTQSYELLKKSSHEELLNAAWNRGFAEYFFNIKEIRRLARMENQNKSIARLAEINKAIREDLRIDPRELAASLFFEMRPIDAERGLAGLKQIFANRKVNSLFEPAVLAEVSLYANIGNELQNKSLQLSDLEFGVVGLENFDSLTNPVKAIEQEIKILSRVETTETAFDIAKSMALFFGLSSALQNLVVLPAGLSYSLAGSSLALTEKDPNTAYKDQLIRDLEDAKTQMIERQKLLLQKRDELEQELLTIKQNNQEKQI